MTEIEPAEFSRHYAAIGADRDQAVIVWGVGISPDEALADAERYLAEQESKSDLTICQITYEQLVAIECEGGCVSLAEAIKISNEPMNLSIVSPQKLWESLAPRVTTERGEYTFLACSWEASKDIDTARSEARSAVDDQEFADSMAEEAVTVRRNSLKLGEMHEQIQEAVKNMANAGTLDGLHRGIRSIRNAIDAASNFEREFIGKDLETEELRREVSYTLATIASVAIDAIVRSAFVGPSGRTQEIL